MDGLIESPYTPGEMAVFTPGREAEYSTLVRLLVGVAGSRRFQGRPHVVQGSRGVGKTSLLRAVERQAIKLGLTTVFVTATRTEGLAAVAEGLAHQIEELDPPGLTDRVRDIVTQVGVKTPLLEVGVDLTDVAAPAGAVRHLRELVTTTARSATASRQGLAIFIDEVQEMPRADIRTLATAWQELDAVAKQDGAASIPAVLMMSGLSNAQEVITEAATFGERFNFITVGDLTADAAREAVLSPALEAGVRWAGAAADMVLEHAHGYPYFLQVYADQTWTVAPRSPGATISVEDASAGVEGAGSQIGSFLRARWRKASAAERDILIAMARIGTAEVSRADIAQALGVQTTALSVARASLLGKGLLSVPRYGYLALNPAGLGDFIREEIDG